jgi:hypothetical protein
MIDNVPASSDPDAGPFLITSSKNLLWVERAFDSGFLRLAVREVPLGELSRSMVEEIAVQGELRGWGNVHPATPAGVKAGVEHLIYYGLPELTLLYGEEFDIGVAPDMARSPADWLPPTWAIMVPDRSYVGTAYTFGQHHVGALVHNPSRGVVILR